MAELEEERIEKESRNEVRKPLPNIPQDAPNYTVQPPLELKPQRTDYEKERDARAARDAKAALDAVTKEEDPTSWATYLLPGLTYFRSRSKSELPSHIISEAHKNLDLGMLPEEVDAKIQQRLDEQETRRQRIEAIKTKVRQSATPV
jgi:hypothetical protein